MWSAPVVVFLPFFQRLSGVVQCAEQCFVQAFISELAVEAFNETVLLGLSRRDVVKWSCFLGQFCGLAKMHLISVHAAFRVSAWPKYAMSGVRLSRAV